jgi:dTDP-4-dehydrorhamnose reductase
VKVLVTGASGQVGRALAEVAGSASELSFTFLDRMALDLAERGSASRLVEQLKPEAVVNAAAFTAVDKAESEPELAYAVNASGAGELAEAAARLGAPTLQLSTDYVFDGRVSEPHGEAAPTNPLNAYGRSKLAGEQAVAAANLRHMIIRTSWVHSPFGTNFVKTMLRLADERDEVRVVADQTGCPTSAQSLAVAIVEILSRWQSGDSSGQGETYHLAGDGSCNWAEFASAIFELSRSLGGPSATVHSVRTEDFPTPAERPRYTVLDCAKFERDFGFRLPAWRDALVPIVERLVDAQ